jgi:hypothetical protein
MRIARSPASRNAGSLPLRMYARIVCTWMPRASAPSSGVRYSREFFFSLSTRSAFQAALRRPGACPQVPGSLYPPRGHLQRTADRSARGPSYLPLERLGRSQPTEAKDARRGRIHTPFPAPRPTGRLRQDSPFRFPGEPPPERRSQAFSHALSGAHTAEPINSRTAKGRRTQMPLLWHRNSLCTRVGSRRGSDLFVCSCSCSHLCGFVVILLRMYCQRWSKNPRASGPRSTERHPKCVRSSILAHSELSLSALSPGLEITIALN